MDKRNMEWLQGSIQGTYEVYDHKLKGDQASWLGTFNQYCGVAKIILESEKKKKRQESHGVCKKVIIIFDHET